MSWTKNDYCFLEVYIVGWCAYFSGKHSHWWLVGFVFAPIVAGFAQSIVRHFADDKAAR